MHAYCFGIGNILVCSFHCIVLMNFKQNVHHVLNAERLAMIRQQRAEAAKKRDEEKAGTSVAICILLRVQIFLLLIYEWLQI
jgi:hypothetical protein